MIDRKKYKYQSGSDGKHGVEGPGNGFGYYAGTLWPELRFSSKADATAAATLWSTAYIEGYEQAQRDIQMALGVRSITP